MLDAERLKTAYEEWLLEQEIPIIEGYSVDDVASIELGPWPRLGALGAGVQMVGMEGLTGVYVIEIPAGGSIAPEKHVFDELMYVILGRGSAQIWSGREGGSENNAQVFDWQTGSLFAPPLNTRHRLSNASDEPARLLVVTSAPIIMDLFHNPDFVFNCDYVFTDRFDDSDDYFEVKNERQLVGSAWMWETNFIPDVRSAELDAQEAKGHGARVTWYQMAGSALVGHMGECVSGKYTKAHHHAGGQIVLTLSSQGYTLMWPPEAGIRPYENGNGHMVIRLDWREGTVVCPPTGWFHQHLNTGPEKARQLALRYGSKKYGVGFKDRLDKAGVLVSIKKGGTQIEYEDEDPQIRSDYRDELEKNGVPYAMPQ